MISVWLFSQIISLFLFFSFLFSFCFSSSFLLFFPFSLFFFLFFMFLFFFHFLFFLFSFILSFFFFLFSFFFLLLFSFAFSFSFSFFFNVFLQIFLSDSCFFLSFFFSFLFLLFLSFSLCFFLCLYFLCLSVSSNHNEQMGRDAFPATPWQNDISKHVWRLPELVDTTQYVVRVQQRTAMCQSMCSEPLSSTSATTRMFTVLLSGRFCLQNLLGSGRRRCSLTRAR